ncbi:DUF6397 family protein [Streptomyces subrutilus]|uniref:DUF6397 family protein n=1 Tax=Streptomyces subrutilus TaxID=36818 RepID=UPI0033FBA3E4
MMTMSTMATMAALATQRGAVLREAVPAGGPGGPGAGVPAGAPGGTGAQLPAEALVGGVRAAGELGLTRGEFARAVQLGIVRAGPSAPGRAARYARAELDRVKADEGGPETLRDRVATVAGAEAAAGVLGIGPSRFTRLARCGHLTPVGYRINRYRAVVWLYLTAELREFAEREPARLRGAAPPADRRLLEAKADLRPRKWRARHIGLLLRRTADPWERAAVLASVLPEEELAGAVPDPAERIVLAALAPPPPYGHPQAPAAAAVALRLLTAGPPEEIHWYRTSLDFALTGARGQSKSTGDRGPT